MPERPRGAPALPRILQGVYATLTISAFGHLRKFGAMERQWSWLKRDLVGGLRVWLVGTLLIPVTFVVMIALGTAGKELLNGEWLAGIKTAGVAILLAVLAYLVYLAYRWLAQKADASPPPAPWTPSSAKAPTGLRGSDYFKKCPACGKFTRHAKVCRHCGCDLT
jgi:hypothetical protein